jgi:hypothetical protein
MSDTDMKARIRGIESQMEKFRFLFGLILSEMILRHCDKLSQTLRSPDLSSVEGHEIAMLTVKLYKHCVLMLILICFQSRRSEWNVEEPQLSRGRKTPRRYKEGSEGSFHMTVESLYRQVYFEVIDLAVNSITSRFDQSDFRIYSNIEELLIKAASGENYETEFSIVCEFYDDLDRKELESVFHTLYQEKMEIAEKPTIKLFTQRSLIDVVILAFKLIIPATNATSEH